MLKKPLKFRKLCCLFVLVQAALSSAEEPRRSLEQFWALAAEGSAELEEARLKVDLAERRRNAVRALVGPQGRLDFFAGPLPTTQISSEDLATARNNWGEWTVLRGIQFELFQPLWTFGALTQARTAASEALNAERSLEARAQWIHRTQVAELYFGYQLAFELSELASSLKSTLDRALKSPKLRAQDRDRLQLGQSEVAARQAEAEKALTQIRWGMGWRTGLLLPTGQIRTPRWDRANLVSDPRAVPSVESLQEQMIRARPEYQALQAEQRAKSALADAEAAQIWPALGLVGRGSWTNTPGRVDAKSPYFADEANEASAFFGVGLRVPLGIWERREKAAQARADALATAARVRHLQSGLFADLVRAHTELVQWSTTHQVRDSGQKASQRILTQATSGFLLGTSDAKSLLDAMVNHSLARKSYLEAIFQLNLAWVKLEQAVGQKL